MSYDCDQDGVDDLLVIGSESEHDGVVAVLVACSGRNGQVLFTQRFSGIDPHIHDLILSHNNNMLYIPLGKTIHRFDLKKRTFVRGPDVGIESVTAVTMADTDGDGHLEAILSRSNSTLVDVDLETGRQRWAYHADGGIPGRVALADLDGDRSPECLFTTQDSGLHCLTGLARKPDWRVYLPGGLTVPGAVADVNRDGNDDVVVAAMDGTVRAFDGLDGRLIQTYAVGSVAGARPIVADLDRDGREELIQGSKSGLLVVFDLASGHPRWQAQLDDAILNVPVVEDVDNDGALEVLVGSEDCRLSCFKGTTGAPVWKTQPLDGPLRFPVACGRAAKDRSLTILAIPSGTDRHQAIVAANTYYSLIDAKTGAIRKKINMYSIDNSVVQLDVNGDGTPEVLHTSHSSVECLDRVTGEPRWKAEPFLNRALNGEMLLLPLDQGTKRYCVAATEEGEAAMLNARDGAKLWSTRLNARVRSTPICHDLDGDQVAEIVIPAMDGMVYGLRVSDGLITHVFPYGGTNENLPPLQIQRKGDRTKKMVVLRNDGTIDVVGSWQPVDLLTSPASNGIATAESAGRQARIERAVAWARDQSRMDAVAQLVARLPESPLVNERWRYVPYWRGIARLQGRTGQISANNLRASRDDFERSLAIAPFLSDARLQLADCLVRLGETDKGLSVARACLAQKEIAPETFKRLANIFLRGKSPDNAAIAFDRFLELSASAPHWHNRNAELFEEIGLSIRRKDWAWAYLCADRYRRNRSVRATPSSSHYCPLIVSLRDGEAAGRKAYGEWSLALPANTDPSDLRAATDALGSYKSLFTDPAAADRLASYLRDQVRFRQELIVSKLATENWKAAAGLYPGDRIISYHGITWRKPGDLARGRFCRRGTRGDRQGRIRAGRPKTNGRH